MTLMRCSTAWRKQASASTPSARTKVTAASPGSMIPTATKWNSGSRSSNRALADRHKMELPMNENLQNIGVLGSSYPLILLAILQIIDLAFTLLHALQERKGQLWRYFGAIAGVKIPDGVGLAVFFGVLTISLWTVGLLGITGTVLWQAPLAFGCLGAIAGCRLSDSVFSHIRLYKEGYRPNPGLPSVPLYFLEALVLVVVFYPTIRVHTFPVVVGFIIGASFFYSVIPTLRIIGRSVFESIEPWQKGSPQPKW